MPNLRKETACILVLIFLGLAFFYKMLYFGFFDVDDYTHISENIAVLTFDLKGLLFKYYIGLYHPLTTLSFAVDWWLGDSKPWIFHLNNFIFHILSALILLKICFKLWPKKYLLGFLISLTFMLHPLKVESVAWVTERKDVLSGLFLWITIYIYLFYLEQKRLWQYILANIAFLLALASKVSVVPLPIFLLALDWYRDKKLGLRLLINKIPFLLMSFTFGLLNVLEQARIRSDLSGIPKKNYLDLLYQVQFYIEKAIFPWGLRTWYSTEFLNFNSIGGISIVVICFLAILIFKRYPTYKKDLLLGLLLFGLFLFPNLRLLPNYSDTDIVHDRYMYIALTGLTFAFFPFILSLIDMLWINQRRIFSLALSGAFAAMMIQWLYLAHLQIPYWKDSITVWQRAVKLEPHSPVISGYFGEALFRLGRYEEALYYLQKSFGRVEDFESLGYVLDFLGKPQEAETIILEGLKIYPDHSLLLNVLGAVKYDQGEHQRALVLFTQALYKLHNEHSPRLLAMILNNLGLANIELGNYGVAESFLKQALSMYKTENKIIRNLGLSLLNQNRLEEAKSAFLQTLKLNPNWAEIHNFMGVIFYREKNFVEARVWFNRTLEVDPNYELAKNNLMEMDKEKQ